MYHYPPPTPSYACKVLQIYKQQSFMFIYMHDIIILIYTYYIALMNPEIINYDKLPTWQKSNVQLLFDSF